jgi:DNA-cytosine methyltransferase
MNILSCFDGISCGRIALERANIQVDKYYSSEIDKYAIQVSKKNYPDIIQLGDITRWKTWNLPQIDLLIGGSPCQGFSNAGIGLNFDDQRSKLFFTFVDILKYYQSSNPDLLFLLENVKMKKEWRNIISSYLEVEPIEINSSLVSAQNRKRLYWTNISGITQPKDKNILLTDILELDTYPIILSNVYGGFKETKPRVHINKSPTIRTATGGGHIPNVIKLEFIKTYKNGKRKKNQNKAACLTGGAHSGGNHSDMDILNFQDSSRRLTPIECERLQTLPDNYTEGISNTQRYKCLSNGWTIDVISHLFSFIDTVSK